MRDQEKDELENCSGLWDGGVGGEDLMMGHCSALGRHHN